MICDSFVVSVNTVNIWWIHQVKEKKKSISVMGTIEATSIEISKYLFLVLISYKQQLEAIATTRQETNGWFKLWKGAQRCILSPCLFN